MSKKYGLIIPGQQQKTPVATAHPQMRNVFDESSSSDSETAHRTGPPNKMKAPQIAVGPSLMERRVARRVQEKALAEDPTIFQYDELYDEMETKREEAIQVKSKEPKKPKYIGRLMEYADRRKLENELRFERQVQKEREAEGEEFKDKESFVTSTYRKKLEEMRKMEEDEKRDDYLEQIGDVTKQNDIDGFYRYLYEQKTGSAKKVQKPEISSTVQDEQEEEVTVQDEQEEEVTYKPIKSGITQKQRAYRKRHSSEEFEDKSDGDEQQKKRAHLTNNIDADSDFSIDSSTDDNEGNENQQDKLNPFSSCSADQPHFVNLDPATIAIKLEAIRKIHDEKSKQSKSKQASESLVESTKTPDEDGKDDTIVVKKEKIDIWKKRTVGVVYEEAVKRYFERKAAKTA